MGALPYKFPRTPHLVGSASTRDDRVLSAEETREVLALPLRVDEKVDGANVGLHFEPAHDEARPFALTLVAQNRGHLLGPGEHPQYAPLWSWIAAREARLRRYLHTRFVLYGEWCYARHSVRYDRLPSYFLAFDLYDKTRRCFLDRPSVRRVCDRCDVDMVPSLHEPVVLGSMRAVAALVGPSRVAFDTRAEGVYLRHEVPGRLLGRYKWVHPEFTAGISTHWSSRPIEKNLLVAHARERHDEGALRS